jgi:hypothetical protein
LPAGEKFLQTPTPTASPDHAAIKAAILLLAQQTQNPNTDLRKVVPQLSAKLDQLGKNTDPDLNNARLALVVAAEKIKTWRTMQHGIDLLRAANPTYGRPAWAARAMLGLGNNSGAQKFLDAVGKKFPNDPEVDVWRAVLDGHLSNWPASEKAARTALQKNTSAGGKALSPFLAATAHYSIYRALLNQAKIEPAETEVKQAVAIAPNEPSFSNGLRAVATAKLHKVIFSRFVYQENIPLGIYHLYTSDEQNGPAGNVCSFTIRTLTTEPRSVRVEASIPGYTETVERGIILLPGAPTVLRLSPPLKVDLAPNLLRSERAGQLLVKITDTTTHDSLFDYTYPVKILPSDTLPLWIRTGEETYKRSFDLMGAWITPNSKGVEAFLSTCKKRAPGQAFVGPFGPSAPQVKAMFDELKASGVTYVMDPSISSDVGSIARTRLPSEILASHNAQCLEGSLLFASLLESIGLDAFVVNVPGHAFVGWMPTKSDKAKPGTVWYLETTMVGGPRTFDQAVVSATARMAQEERAGHFKSGASFITYVRNMRKLGVTPQPYQ